MAVPTPARRPARPAAQGVYAWQERRRALLDSVLSAPARVESYFAASPLRRCAWGAVAYGGGYYAGNVVTLSFGALAINDVLAAALTVGCGLRRHARASTSVVAGQSAEWLQRKMLQLVLSCAFLFGPQGSRRLRRALPCAPGPRRWPFTRS